MSTVPSSLAVDNPLASARYTHIGTMRGVRPVLLVDGLMIQGPPLADCTAQVDATWRARLTDQFLRWHDNARHDLIQDERCALIFHCPATM